MLWQCTIITALWVFCILIFNNYIFNHRPLSSINSIFQVQVRYYSYCSSSSMTQHTTAHTRMVYRTTNKKSKKERRRRRGERRGKKKKRKNHNILLLSFYNIIYYTVHTTPPPPFGLFFFFCLFLDVFFYTNLFDCFVVVQLSIDNVFHFKRSF